MTMKRKGIKMIYAVIFGMEPLGAFFSKEAAEKYVIEKKEEFKNDPFVEGIYIEEFPLLDEKIMEIITSLGALSDGFSLHLCSFLEKAFVVGEIYEAREEFYRWHIQVIKEYIDVVRIKTLPEEARKELDDKLRIVDGIIRDIRIKLR